MSKVKKFLAFLLIASILICVSYLIVYKASILPNGYDLEEVQNDYVSLKSFNIIGVEKDIVTQSFSENEDWKIWEIKYEVNRQKEFLWLLFSMGSISMFLLIYKVRNGLEFWKAVFDSNIIIAVLLPLIPVIRSLNRIFDLIS
jgi:hypothetical protein